MKKQRNSHRLRFWTGLLGLALAVLVFRLVPGAEHPKAPHVAAMVTLMAVWWIFEVVPIAVTSLFPLIFLPFFNVADMETVGANYGRPIIFLFLGGFILALGLQQSGLHKRIALNIVHRLGSRPAHLVLGFMLACGLMSMWISNTASVMVMLPICLSILEQIKESGAPPEVMSRFGLSLMLGIAYAADIGGMATVIGTPPNLVFLEMLHQLFPEAPEVGFLQWMLMGIPLATVFMAAGWIMLTRVTFPLPGEAFFSGKEVIRQYLRALGPLRRDELLSGLTFLLAALLWITGSDLNLGEDFHIQGWRSLLGLQAVSDSVVAIACATLLFIVPSKDRPREALLEWPVARRIPWGILLLFGGGFAIAEAFEYSGLSGIIGALFHDMTFRSPILVVAVINTFLTFLTELTSNTAMTNLVLPILAEAAVILEFDPRLLMIPATLSASCAFMMPIASPTQAIVFGSGYVPIRQMIRAGIWFNLLGIFLVTLVFLTLGLGIFGIATEGLPAWAGSGLE